VQASYSATYDALKRRTGFNDSDLGSCSDFPLPASCSGSGDVAWKYAYDADGNQLSQVDPRNQAVYASYDLLDRPLCRGTSSAAVNPCGNSTYAQFFYDSYDNTSNPGVTFPAGCVAPTSPYASDPIGSKTAELFSSSAGSGWRCYGYDQRGKQDQSTLSVTADGTTTTQTMNMSYNDGGEIAGLVYPDGETLTSQYDVNGRFQNAYFGTPSTPDPVNFLVGQTGYTGSGQLSSLAIGGSGPKSGTPTPVFTENIGYDGIQRPQSTSATVGSSTLWSQGRTYDNVGNVLQLATTVPTVGGGTQTDTQSFCYDALSRLIWAGNSGTPTGGDHCGNAPAGSTVPVYQQSFNYDNLDRLTSGPAGSLTYGDINHVHAATSLGSMPNPYAAYDAMGNMTCRNTDTGSGHTCGSSPTGTQMSYDNEGRLASWTAPSGTTASDGFLYDNEGTRVLQRVSNGTITDTITFDGYTETVITGGTPTTTKYYSANSQRVAMRTNSTLSYLLADALGSSTVALDSTGTTQAVQLFAPYGSIRYSQGTMPTTYNFTGQRLDSQTGLLYYNFRYYDPVSGRFVRADTTETNAGGMDPYAYVGDNPESKNDPTGHCWPLCTMLAGAIAGAVIGAGISAISQAVSGHGVNWGEVGKAAIVGAISGGIAGLAGPGAPVAEILGTAAIVPVAAGFAALGAAAGAVGGAVGQVANNALHGQSLVNGVGQSALVGGLTGAVFGVLQIATPLGRGIAGPLFSRFGRVMTFTLDRSAISDADAQLAQRFVNESNNLLVRGVNLVRTAVSPALRRAASADANAWAALQDVTPPGMDASHIPDTTWTGVPQPPGGYMWLPSGINSSFGAQARWFLPYGTSPSWFNLRWR